MVMLKCVTARCSWQGSKRLPDDPKLVECSWCAESLRVEKCNSIILITVSLSINISLHTIIHGDLKLYSLPSCVHWFFVFSSLPFFFCLTLPVSITVKLILVVDMVRLTLAPPNLTLGTSPSTLTIFLLA